MSSHTISASSYVVAIPAGYRRPASTVSAGYRRPASTASAGYRRPTSNTVYARRRVLAATFLIVLLLGLWLGAGTVLANRGGAPASASTVRPASADHVYVVQAGDTLWSIGGRFHGSQSRADYVDDLVAANGGSASLAIGQRLTLP